MTRLPPAFYVFVALLTGATLAAAPAAAQRGARDPLATLVAADKNRDGIVTRAEFAAARMNQFDKMDRNDDGYVSRDDFARLLRFRPEAGQRLDQLLALSDANHDGRLSRAEQSAAPMRIFDRVDTNIDDRVDQAELKAARAQIEALRAEFGAGAD